MWVECTSFPRIGVVSETLPVGECPLNSAQAVAALRDPFRGSWQDVVDQGNSGNITLGRLSEQAVWVLALSAKTVPVERRIAALDLLPIMSSPGAQLQRKLRNGLDQTRDPSISFWLAYVFSIFGRNRDRYSLIRCLCRASETDLAWAPYEELPNWTLEAQLRMSILQTVFDRAPDAWSGAYTDDFWELHVRRHLRRYSNRLAPHP
jgi:hypothetical protein